MLTKNVKKLRKEPCEECVDGNGFLWDAKLIKSHLQSTFPTQLLGLSFHSQSVARGVFQMEVE
jgi:hypothetical protein